MLGNALGDRPCEVYSSDVRIRVPATGLSAYPDLSVVCGPTEINPENRNTIVNPVVLVEVLSDSSRKYNLTIKQSHYLRLRSLQDYLVVEQDEPLIHHFTRNEDGSWTVRLLAPPELVRLFNRYRIRRRRRLQEHAARLTKRRERSVTAGHRAEDGVECA